MSPPVLWQSGVALEPPRPRNTKTLIKRRDPFGFPTVVLVLVPYEKKKQQWRTCNGKNKRGIGITHDVCDADSDTFSRVPGKRQPPFVSPLPITIFFFSKFRKAPRQTTTTTTTTSQVPWGARRNVEKQSVEKAHRPTPPESFLLKTEMTGERIKNFLTSDASNV
ncbi:hypothetical protein RUM44_009954 [Polyplax serrata]|uniref:Uncharacterized protein n=1 Tax=Polyplax serrata TaxID=468196 RepID=A0ABR1AU77_POLSC